MASAGQSSDLQSVVALVKSLLNSQLKNILRSEYLPVSGVKSVLQTRIIDYLKELSQGGQIERYNRLKKFIYATAHHPMPTAPTHSPTSIYQQPHPAPPPFSVQTRPAFSGTLTPSQPFQHGRLSFKDCPFFTILEPLTPIVECKVREHTRDSVDLKVIFNSGVASRLQNDPSTRVMVYCAADNGLTQYSKCDITFPHQVELKANLDDVKANLRGLKNRAGSTRPADITNFVRKKPGYPNHVVMTYALTQKKFFVVVNLVQRHSVEELVAKLQTRKTISSDQVIREMRSKAEDGDIVATSTVMSLKCPLSTLRISVPCRSTICTHNQCFDATSFLQLQEQAPTWTCPVCNKTTNFEALQVDQYVDNILRSTLSTVEQVTIEPNGEWSNPTHHNESTRKGESTNTEEEDDDLVEIQDGRVLSLKQEFPIHVSLQRTPSLQPHETSSISSGQRQSTNKRPASVVIDLTGSDDETPPRPSKRLSHNPSDRYTLQEYGSFQSGGGLNKPSFGVPSQTSSKSPASTSYYYDA